MLVDCHSHLYDVKNYEVPDDILPVVVGYSYSSNRKAVEIARGRYPYVLGIAPQTAIKRGTEGLDEAIAFIRENRPVAIGEVGLDYKWAQTKEDVEKQKAVFQAMIDLADEMKLPLVIHSRNNPNENEVPKNAIEDIIGMIKGRKVLMHFYSGNAEQAGRIVAEGGYISIVHFRSKERRKVINTVTIDRLVVESDCPYVGRTPETIREAIDYIAEVKGMDRGEVASKTTENAMDFFGFKV